MLDTDRILATAKLLLGEGGAPDAEDIETPENEYSRAILELTAFLIGQTSEAEIRAIGERLGLRRDGSHAPVAANPLPPVPGNLSHTEEWVVLMDAAQQMIDLTLAAPEENRRYGATMLWHMQRAVGTGRSGGPLDSLIREAAQAMFDIDEALSPAMRHNDEATHERLRVALAPLPGPTVKIRRSYLTRVSQVYEVAMSLEDARALYAEDTIELDERVLGSRLLTDSTESVDDDDLWHAFV